METRQGGAAAPEVWRPQRSGKTCLESIDNSFAPGAASLKRHSRHHSTHVTGILATAAVPIHVHSRSRPRSSAEMGLKKSSNDVEAVAPFVEFVETRYCSDTHKTWHEIVPFIGKVVSELGSTAEVVPDELQLAEHGLLSPNQTAFQNFCGERTEGRRNVSRKLRSRKKVCK